MMSTNAQDMERPRRRTGTNRERTGCLTCRRRKKKCDKVYPICTHCRRLNLVCVHEEPRTDESVRQCASPTAEYFSGKSPAPALVIGLNPISSSSLESQVDRASSPSLVRRRMLVYYTESFTTLLTTNLQNNAFLSVLLPMSIESSALLDAVVAWSASHLALRQSTFKEVALEARCASLESLSKSINSMDYSPDLALANTMVLCSMETILGTSQWLHHLQGGCQIIRAAANSVTLQKYFNTSEGHWLLRNYAYHDAMMSITVNRRPLLPYDLYDIADDSVVADSYVGFAFPAVKLAMEISHLRSDMAEWAEQRTRISEGETETTSFTSLTFSERAFTLEEQLNAWKCPPTEDIPLSCLAETYRSATLIHLYRSIRQHFPQLLGILSQKITVQVAKICEDVAKMPLGCLPECTLLFPLFLAGGEAEAEEHISLVRDRMSRLIEHRSFENVRSALIVLEELWRLRAKGSCAEGQRKVDWMDVLERRAWTLAIS